ncbi:Protein kinase domain-containing protein [Psidium guajava]|nr:Protein kinase domain-containing protein [Psidium guajava]
MEDSSPSKALWFHSFLVNQKTERGIEVILLFLLRCNKCPTKPKVLARVTSNNPR